MHVTFHDQALSLQLLLLAYNTRARVLIYRALSSKGGGEPGNEANIVAK